MTTTKSLFRHFRWYDYVIIAVNIAAVILSIAVGEHAAALSNFAVAVLYAMYAWYLGAYSEAKRDLRSLRSRALSR